MTHRIKIVENISIHEIARNWNVKPNGEVVFEIFHLSSFQLFAEGVALGKLRDFELSGVQIRIELFQNPLLNGVFPPTPPPKEKKKYVIDDNRLPPLLSTIFGLELLNIAKSAYDRGDAAEEDLRADLGRHIWERAKKNNGCLSTANAIHLISWRGSAVAEALSTPNSPKFPSLETFQAKLGPYISTLRGNTLSTSEAEEKLIEWIFHAAENSFDHASKFEDKPIRGFRGIILQKIIFYSLKDLQGRKDLPDFAMNYITERVEDRDVSRHRVVNVASVVDLGVGIHTTVPSPGAKSDLDRLQYAFIDGVTRKDKKENEKAGYGLGQLADAAKWLKAFIYIISGSMSAYYDYSDEEEMRLPDQGLALTQLEKIEKSSGSVVSLIWVHDPLRDDQATIDL